MKTLANVHARFYGLIKLFPHLTKEDVVWQYSGMMTTSLSTFYEKKPTAYFAMISELQTIANSMKTPEQLASDGIKKLRSAILHRLQKHGVNTTDWSKVNSFLENPRIAGKRLYNMSEADMRAFIPKMESILAKDKIHNAEIKRQATQN